MSATATISVTFGSNAANASAAAANAHLSAELDPRPTGLNGGKTQFNPGETAWFLVYMSDNVTLPSAPISSAGSVTAPQAVTGIQKTQELTFMGVNTSTIQVPSTGIVSHKWLGRNLGNLTLTGNKTGIECSTAGVGVCKITYTCNALAFGVTSPYSLDGETMFTIAVLFTGELVA